MLPQPSMKFRRWPAGAAVAAAWCLLVSPGAAGQRETLQRVTVDRLVQAMELQRGFDITATTNGSRFQGGVILQLARWARERNPDGPPLIIPYDVSFEAFLKVAKLTPERAPVFAKLAFDHRQDQVIEYRPERVLARVEVGPRPSLAVSVTASWPDNLANSFSYLDTFSTPNLRVTNQRHVSYKLVDFDNFLLYDEISGVSGRPTTGLLGLLFRVLGDSDVLQSRSAVSPDGLQIAVAHARKGFIHRTAVVTIEPGGRAEQGVNADRPDLRDIERRLQQDIRIRYR